MKLWKPEIRIRDIPLVVHALLPAASACQQIVIVGGYRFQALVQLVSGSKTLSKANIEKIVFVENKNFTAGMFSSVKIGIREVDQSLGGVFIVPGDMPFIDVRTYRTLADSFRNNSGIDVFVPAVIVDGEIAKDEGRLKKGHPILMRQRMHASILREDDDSVLRDVVKNNSSEICTVEDNGICIDIDEETDLGRYNSYFKKGRA
jgi:CTP:molybdopterin cytidylyltransferase MocA